MEGKAMRCCVERLLIWSVCFVFQCDLKRATNKSDSQRGGRGGFRGGRGGGFSK